MANRPKDWGTALGTGAQVINAVAPRVLDAILHTAYLAFPDSTAAGGKDESPIKKAPEALSRGAVVMMRLLPGVHW
jgi:hypothetical protein